MLYLELQFDLSSKAIFFDFDEKGKLKWKMIDELQSISVLFESIGFRYLLS